jgi:hypothetical protein
MLTIISFLKYYLYTPFKIVPQSIFSPCSVSFCLSHTIKHIFKLFFYIAVEVTTAFGLLVSFCGTASQTFYYRVSAFRANLCYSPPRPSLPEKMQFSTLYPHS